MLLNLHKKSWMEGLTLQDYSEHCKLNETIVKEMLELAKNYNKVNTILQCIYIIYYSFKTKQYDKCYTQPYTVMFSVFPNLCTGWHCY